MDAGTGLDSAAAVSGASSGQRRHLPLIDFHCHGGDVSRADEIAAYIHSEGLSALGLLSLPLSGYPGYSGDAPHLNEAVLDTKKRLDRRFEEELSVSGKAGKSPVRIHAFGCLDNRSLLGRTAGPDSAAQVAALRKTGFDGLKIWEGKPEMAAALHLMPDSPWIVEACREAGRRDMPVIIHIADPPEFWDPSTGNTSSKGYGQDGLSTPGYREIIDAALELCAAVPEASIVFPHLGFLAGNLERADEFLTDAPNACFDLAPGNYFYAELTQNPTESAAFFSRWRNRILFGSDSFFFPENPPAGTSIGVPDTSEGLPFAGDSLEGNRRRLRRLRAFLESPPGETVENVYPLSRDAIPEVHCLGLGEEILLPIFSGNAAALL